MYVSPYCFGRTLTAILTEQEVMVITKKPKLPDSVPPLRFTQKHTAKASSLSDTLFSQPTTASTPHLPASRAYSILRTLKHSPAQSVYLACNPQLSNGMVVVNAYQLPVSRKAQSERDALRAIVSTEPEDDSPYLEQMICAWENERAAYLVTPYHPGGNLLHYIKTMGSLSKDLLKLWASELVGILFSNGDSIY
jgi:serine/threonine protein kinase